MLWFAGRYFNTSLRHHKKDLRTSTPTEANSLEHNHDNAFFVVFVLLQYNSTFFSTCMLKSAISQYQPNKQTQMVKTAFELLNKTTFSPTYLESNACLLLFGAQQSAAQPSA